MRRVRYEAQHSPPLGSPVGKSAVAVRAELPTVAAIGVMAALYAGAWGGLVLSWDGVYWDDWIYVSAAPGQILQMTRELGLPWVGFMLEGLLALGPRLYHSLSLLLYFSVGISTFGILRRVPSVTPNERIFLSALVLVLPLMAARHALIVQHYAMSYALFYLAWYLLVRTSPPRPVALWTAGTLFAASFTTNSLLVFYLVPMAHLWYQVGFRGKVGLRDFLGRYGPLLALPVGWYAAKSVLFAPYGLYEGYNEIDPGLLAGVTGLLAVSSVPLAAIYAVRGRLGSRTLRVLAPLSAGVVLSVLATYPYLVVGKQFPFEEWETRNELLLPLGVAFIALGVCRAIQALLGRRAAQGAGIAILAGSVVISAAFCASYSVDWQKQQSLIALFRETPALRSASTVVFRDETRHMNIFGRSFRFYEWNGLMKRAFGDETRFGVTEDQRQIRRLLTGRLSRYELYAARDFVPGARVLEVTITTRDGSDPARVELPFVSTYLPVYEEILIQTRVLTREQVLQRN